MSFGNDFKSKFQSDPVAQRLLVMKLIASVLIAGVLVSASVALAVGTALINPKATAEAPKDTETPTAPILSGVAITAAIFWCAIGWLVFSKGPQTMIPRIAESLRENPAEAKSQLAGIWMTVMIVQLAFFEGAAIFGVVAYAVEAQPWALGATALGVGLMVAFFPTEARFHDWLEDQKEKIAQSRRQTLA